MAFAFWGALSALSVLGLRYPLQMVPLLLVQFVYKLVWALAIAVPQWYAVRSLELTHSMLVGLVIDLIVISCPYYGSLSPATRRILSPRRFLTEWRSQ